jgi:hypothetical protein
MESEAPETQALKERKESKVERILRRRRLHWKADQEAD